MRDRLNLTLPVEMITRINELSERKKISRSAIVEAAVASFLSPDAADRREAAFTRRMDRLSRQSQRIERDLGVTAETLALFVRFWLASTPALPESAQAEARAKGLQRYDGFVDALGRRLSKGPKLRQEIAEDIPPASPADTDDLPAG